MMQDQKLSFEDVRAAKFRDTIFLNAEEFANINNAVIETPVQDNVMLNAFPLKQGGNIWAMTHVYTKLDRYGNATESLTPGDAEAIAVDGTKVTVDVPFYHADFIVSQFDLNNSKMLGERIDTVKARATTRKVNDLFDAAIYKRSSLFGSLGARNLFTGTASASAKWTGTSPDVIFNDINTFIAAIPAAYTSQNLRMVLHQTDFNSLARVNSYGINAIKLLRDTYSQLQILVSGQVTAGEGILYPFRDDVAYTFTAFPLQTLEWVAHPIEARYKVLRSGRFICVAATAGINLNGLS